MRERKISGTQMEEGGGKSRLENLSLTFGQIHLYICTFVLLDIVTFVLFTFAHLYRFICQIHLCRLAEGRKSILASWKGGTAIKQVTI